MQLCKNWMLAMLFPLLFKFNIARAENDQAAEALNEDFLLFLAEVSVYDEQTVDPLSMLDIEDEEMNDSDKLKNAAPSVARDTNKMTEEISAKSTVKEDQ